MRCPHLQGYLLGRPASPEQLPTDHVELPAAAEGTTHRP
jgi:EAL domain-containing protein (putative c-di-GMP-specific phosphodiesterase class I)